MMMEVGAVTSIFQTFKSKLINIDEEEEEEREVEVFIHRFYQLRILFKYLILKP